jgi:hypothetical protein
MAAGTTYWFSNPRARRSRNIYLLQPRNNSSVRYVAGAVHACGAAAAAAAAAAARSRRPAAAAAGSPAPEGHQRWMLGCDLYSYVDMVRYHNLDSGSTVRSSASKTAHYSNPSLMVQCRRFSLLVARPKIACLQASSIRRIHYEENRRRMARGRNEHRSTVHQKTR